MSARHDELGDPLPRTTRLIDVGIDPGPPDPLPPGHPIIQAIRRASTHAAEARQRDAARRAEEERGETAREWALARIAERLPS